MLSPRDSRVTKYLQYYSDSETDMSVEQVLRILYPGVKGLLSQTQATNLVLSLTILATDPIDAETLRFYSRYYTPGDYAELVSERVLVHRCGYPLCQNKLSHHQGKLSHLISEWNASFCSKDCFQASRFYAHQLSPETLVTRLDVAFTSYGQSKYETGILLLSEVKQIAHKENKPIAQVIHELVHAHSSLEAPMRQLHLSEAQPAFEGSQLQIQENPTSTGPLPEFNESMAYTS